MGNIDGYMQSIGLTECDYEELIHPSTEHGYIETITDVRWSVTLPDHRKVVVFETEGMNYLLMTVTPAGSAVVELLKFPGYDFLYYFQDKLVEASKDG